VPFCVSVCFHDCVAKAIGNSHLSLSHLPRPADRQRRRFPCPNCSCGSTPSTTTDTPARPRPQGEIRRDNVSARRAFGRRGIASRSLTAPAKTLPGLRPGGPTAPIAEAKGNGRDQRSEVGGQKSEVSGQKRRRRRIGHLVNWSIGGSRGAPQAGCHGRVLSRPWKPRLRPSDARVSETPVAPNAGGARWLRTPNSELPLQRRIVSPLQGSGRGCGGPGTQGVALGW